MTNSYKMVNYYINLLTSLIFQLLYRKIYSNISRIIDIVDIINKHGAEEDRDRKNIR